MDRFGEMEVESSLLAFLDVFFRPKSGQRDSSDTLLSFRFRDDVITAAIWKTNVAQNDIKRFGRQDFESAFGAFGDGNIVTEMFQQPRQCLAGVAMIFHQQNTQRSVRFGRN